MTKFAWLLSMAVGFLSLSQEILWVRVVSFGTRGMSQSFALVLFLFLIGIAIGSAVGKRLCTHHTDLLRTSAVVLGLAAVLDLSLIAILPVVTSPPSAALFPLIVLTAALKSVMFPIAHHLGSQQSGARIGRSVSKVYFGNILGSTLGPIVTGYILLDRLSLDQCLLLVGLSTGLLSLLCALRAGTARVGLAVAATLVPVTVLAWTGMGTGPAGVTGAIAQRHFVEDPGAKVHHLIENRHGIIHTLARSDGLPDTIMGGNVYDGMISVDMQANKNQLDRALVMLAQHPNPERVLVIGLSTGAWARILSASPRIKEMVVVEINPGYLQLISRYPEVAGLLTDPRIRIVVDDARRWLRRNPHEKFDLIVQNTTSSWRAYTNNLLSREYMQLTRSHLRPGGIAGTNSTWSGDVVKTAHAVFPFVERRNNFIYGSNSDFSRPAAGAETRLREMKIDQAPVFAESAFQSGGLARDMIDKPFVPHEEHYSGMSTAPALITDQNPLVEHAHGALRSRLPAFYRQVDAAREALNR